MPSRETGALKSFLNSFIAELYSNVPNFEWQNKLIQDVEKEIDNGFSFLRQIILDFELQPHVVELGAVLCCLDDENDYIGCRRFLEVFSLFLSSFPPQFSVSQISYSRSLKSEAIRRINQFFTSTCLRVCLSSSSSESDLIFLIHSRHIQLPSAFAEWQASQSSSSSSSSSSSEDETAPKKKVSLQLSGKSFPKLREFAESIYCWAISPSVVVKIVGCLTRQQCQCWRALISKAAACQTDITDDLALRIGLQILIENPTKHSPLPNDIFGSHFSSSEKKIQKIDWKGGVNLVVERNSDARIVSPRLREDERETEIENENKSNVSTGSKMKDRNLKEVVGNRPTEMDKQQSTNFVQSDYINLNRSSSSSRNSSPVFELQNYSTVSKDKYRQPTQHTKVENGVRSVPAVTQLVNPVSSNSFLLSSQNSLKRSSCAGSLESNKMKTESKKGSVVETHMVPIKVPAISVASKKTDIQISNAEIARENESRVPRDSLPTKKIASPVVNSSQFLYPVNDKNNSKKFIAESTNPPVTNPAEKMTSQKSTYQVPVQNDTKCDTLKKNVENATTTELLALPSRSAQDAKRRTTEPAPKLSGDDLTQGLTDLSPSECSPENNKSSNQSNLGVLSQASSRSTVDAHCAAPDTTRGNQQSCLSASEVKPTASPVVDSDSSSEDNDSDSENNTFTNIQGHITSRRRTTQEDSDD